MLDFIREPLRAYLARKRFERSRYEAARQLLESDYPSLAAEDPDADDWRLVGSAGKGLELADAAGIRDKARDLCHRNPHARNIIHVLKIYTVGAGMTFQITPTRVKLMGVVYSS